MLEDFDRKAALYEIIERELTMFQAVNNEGGTADCQQRPETFRVMRRMTHDVHDDEVLASYLEDLRRAETEGRNFMVEKYARMDDRLPPLSTSPLLDEIADAETAFLEEACQQYPHVIKSSGKGIFRHYMRCELETLSPATLTLYAEEIRRAKEAGRNLAVERHECLAHLLGRESLAAYEASAAAKA